MDVESTVLKMIKAYPTLYETRVTALEKLFDSYDTRWQNGELLRLEEDPVGDSFLPYKEDEVADPTEPDGAGTVLFRRRENAKAQFVLDNAYLLSAVKYSRYPDHYCVRFSGRRFNDIPDDVKPEWLEAAKELASLILAHRFTPRDGTSPEYMKSESTAHATSVKICKQFLERFRVITVCPFAREARKAELQREAAALGLTLVEQTDQAPAPAGT